MTKTWPLPAKKQARKGHRRPNGKISWPNLEPNLKPSPKPKAGGKSREKIEQSKAERKKAEAKAERKNPGIQAEAQKPKETDKVEISVEPREKDVFHLRRLCGEVSLGHECKINDVVDAKKT